MPDNKRYPLTVTERLNFGAIPEWLLALAQRFQQAGHQSYLVGGSVRDLLWGDTPQDWDLASDALPEQVEALFARTIPSGKPYGTITIVTPQAQVEVTTLRQDLGYQDGRHPQQVKFGRDILADLARRDFTINALAYDFSSRELVDPARGRHDCYQRILRAVGDPRQRFAEDGLRMWRYFRFLATLDLKAHRATTRAINPVWTEPVSTERLRDELSRLLLGNWVRRGLSGLKQSGLLESLIPELKGFKLCHQGCRQRWDLWEHTLITVESVPPRLELRLAALLHDIAKPLTRFTDQSGVHFYGHDQSGAEQSQVILERLRYPAKLVTAVTHLIRYHMFQLPPPIGAAAVRRLLARVGPEYLPDLLELRRADLAATGRVERHTWEAWQDLQSCIGAVLADAPVLDRTELALNGADLMQRFKLEPGPLVGELLDHLWEVVLEDPQLNQRQQLLELAAAYLQSRPAN